MNEMEKTLIGLIPQKIDDIKRITEIINALSRYVVDHKEIPIEWIEEYNELIEEYNELIKNADQ